MKKKLIGFKRFTSKKGSPTCIALVATPFDERQNEKGNYGCDVETLFLPSELFNYLEEGDLGKEVTTDYDIVSGRAYLRNFTVLRDAKK